MNAREIGVEDAAGDFPFCPESIYIAPGCMADYAQGFLSVKNDNAAALSFLGLDVYAHRRAVDLAVDEAQYTPRPNYDF